jgi:hypothetical protein
MTSTPARDDVAIGDHIAALVDEKTRAGAVRLGGAAVATGDRRPGRDPTDAELGRLHDIGDGHRGRNGFGLFRLDDRRGRRRRDNGRSPGMRIVKRVAGGAGGQKSGLADHSCGGLGHLRSPYRASPASKRRTDTVPNF